MRRLIIKKGGYTESTFRDATPGSALDRLFKREARRHGGDEDAAVLPLKDALDEVVTVPLTALYYQVESVRKYREYDCQLLMPWVSPIPVSSSLALPRGSGLKSIFLLVMLRAIEVIIVSNLSVA